MKTLFKSILLISLLLSCQKDNYEEVHLPVLAMNVPEIMQLDSVRLSARILNEGFSELMIAKRGFVLAAEGFQQDWAPKHTDKSWEIGADYIDGPSFSADISNLPIRTEDFSGEYEAAPFLDLEMGADIGQRRVYGPKRTFFLEGIELPLSITEANHQIFLDFGVEASGAALSEYGLCWLVMEAQQENGFRFSLEEVPEENFLRNPPSEINLQLPLGKFIYLQPYANFKGNIYYGQVEEIFIGNYWETVEAEDYQSGGYPHQLYGTAGFFMKGKGYVFGGRKDIGDGNDPPQSILWEFQPEARAWWAASSLPVSQTGEPGERHDATAFVINDKAYIGLGRRISRDVAFQSFFEYTPESGFREVASYPYPAYRAASFVIGEKAYVGTGANPNGSSYFKFYSFDPKDATETDENGLPMGKWKEVSAFPIAVEGAVGFTIGNKGYVGAGYTKQTNTLRQEFYEFDPSTWELGTWKAVAPFEGTPRQIAMAFVIGDKAYVGGGANFATGYLLADYKDFWEFDPNKNDWTRIEDIGLYPHSAAACFSIGEKGYVYGGYIQSGVITATSTTDIYTPER